MNCAQQPGTQEKPGSGPQINSRVTSGTVPRQRSLQPSLTSAYLPKTQVTLYRIRRKREGGSTTGRMILSNMLITEEITIQQGQAWRPMPVIPAFWEAKAGRSLELRSSWPAWATWWKPISTKNAKISPAWWCMPVVLATQEVEVGGLHGPGSGLCSKHWTPAWVTKWHPSETLPQKLNKQTNEKNNLRKDFKCFMTIFLSTNIHFSMNSSINLKLEFWRLNQIGEKESAREPWVTLASKELK